MNRRGKTLLISGAVVIAVTAAILAICIEDWVDLIPLTAAFMFWAELVLFVGLTLTEMQAGATESIITRVSTGVVVSFYSVAAFLLSLLFMISFRESFKTFIVLQLLLLAVAAVTLLAANAASRGIRSSNTRTDSATELLSSYITRLGALAALNPIDGAELTLKKLADDLRFTDHSVVVGIDREIGDTISVLELELAKAADSRSDDTIKSEYVRLNSLIAQRKLETKAAKTGGI